MRCSATASPPGQSRRRRHVDSKSEVIALFEDAGYAAIAGVNLIRL
jgi:hypothetical protein